MVAVAQLVRALVCGTRGRGFDSLQPPKELSVKAALFFCQSVRFSQFITIFAAVSKYKL